MLLRLTLLSLLTMSSCVIALPFMPIDARGLAMGNTGVATARLAHAPAYNPSLLTQAQADDDFALLLPQFGFVLADEGDIFKTGNKIKTSVLPEFDRLLASSGTNNFKSSLDNMKTASSALSTAINSASSVSDPVSASAAVTNLTDKNNNFRASIDDLKVQLKKMNTATDDLNSKLGDMSGNPLRARLGMATAFAFPSKKYAFAMSISNNLNISGRIFFTQTDRNLIAAYGKAADGYTDGAYVIPDTVDSLINKLNAVSSGSGTLPNASEYTTLKGKTDAVDNYTSEQVNTAGGNIRIMQNGALSNEAKNPEFDSKVQFVGMNILELGFSGAREFNIKGHTVAFGVTPKVLSIETFHYGTSLNNKEKINKDAIQKARTSYIDGNLDLGASYRFPQYPSWLVGASIKNLIPRSYKTKDTDVKDENGIVIDRLNGPTLHIYPQLRVGGSYTNDWFVGTAELDITENKPVAFEAATRYLAFGAEFDLYDSAQFRTGIRTNLSASNPLEQSTLSLGLGLSPSIVEMNLAVMANPSDWRREFGLALELGLAF